MNRKVGCIYAEHGFCASYAGIQCKRAGMSKTVEDFLILAEHVDCGAVIFLIEEKSGFLAVFHVHDVADAVFDDFHFGVECFADEALAGR